VAIGIKLVIQIALHSALSWIGPGKYIPWVLGLFEWPNELQMSWNRSYWKAWILSFKRVGRAGNYPTWISLHKLDKTGFVTECWLGQNWKLTAHTLLLFLDFGAYYWTSWTALGLMVRLHGAISIIYYLGKWPLRLWSSLVMIHHPLS